MSSSKRNTNESFENYRARLNAESEFAKQRSKGVVLWDSKRQGTYVTKKHGSL